MEPFKNFHGVIKFTVLENKEEEIFETKVLRKDS